MATYTVTTLLDESTNPELAPDAVREGADGTGLSLREALDLANAMAGADEIVFDPGLAGGRITLTGAALRITDDVTIRGDAAGGGTSRMILDGDYRSRVFEAEAGTSALSGLDITRGGVDPREARLFGDGGGLLIAEAAELAISDARIFRNAAGDSGSTLGGGIYNLGTLSVDGSEIFDNSAGFSRDGSDGGGIANSGTLFIRDTLISDNSATGRIPGGGGGLFNTGTAYATNVMLSGNHGYEGSAISNSGTLVASGATVSGNGTGSTWVGDPTAIWNTGSLTLVQSSVAGNTGPEIENAGTLTLVNSILTEADGAIALKAGRNIVGLALFDGETRTASLRIEDVFADLGPDGPVLADNGGSLPTLRLRASDLNPALDAADPALAVDALGAPLSTDARGAGFARVVDLPFAGAAQTPVDLGAFELRFDPVNTIEVADDVLPVLSYGGEQDRNGTFDIVGLPGALVQTGNAWNHVLANYEVTRDTVLTFRLATTGTAEIFGIGFDNDDRADSGTYFQLGGTQQGFGIQDFNTGPAGPQQEQEFRIPVGDYFTGAFDRLVFVTDQDAPPPASGEAITSVWSGVDLFDDGPRVRLNDAYETLLSYSPRQDRGTAEVLQDGQVVVQGSNSWKRIDIDYQVTENTVLRFEFDSSSQGELHAIGFATEDQPDWLGDTFFTLLGTQEGFGNRDFYDVGIVDEGGLRSFEIPVGQYFTGAFDSLVLVTDDDAGTGANSVWADLVLADQTLIAGI